MGSDPCRCCVVHGKTSGVRWFGDVVVVDNGWGITQQQHQHTTDPNFFSRAAAYLRAACLLLPDCLSDHTTTPRPCRLVCCFLLRFPCFAPSIHHLSDRLKARWMSILAVIRTEHGKTTPVRIYTIYCSHSSRRECVRSLW